MHIARSTLLGVLLTFVAAAPAAAKTYSAERFDVVIRVLPGGTLDIVETVVFRFESGTFRQVFREIPSRRNDGVEIVEAAMDGTPMPFGDRAGEVEVRRRQRTRVVWRFAPVSGTIHTFRLTYRVRGAVQQRDGGDVLAWRALPSQHAYRIQSAAIEVHLPAPPARAPAIDTHRVADAGIEQHEDSVRIVASSIRANGWVEASLHFPPRSVIEAPPAWQQHQIRTQALAPQWLTAGGLVLVAGVMLIVAVRQRYDPPPRDRHRIGTMPAAPDSLPPALAGAAAANGAVSHSHALAVLFSLADRGEIDIVEEPRRAWGQRQFTLRRRRAGARLAPHEETLLRLAFTDQHGEDEAVPLAKARSRLARGLGKFRSEVDAELAAAGLLDADRARVRHRLGLLALGMFIAGSAGLVAAAFFVRHYGPWPLVVPAALLVAALISLIAMTAATPLSNEGVQRGERWRAYRQHLKEVAQERAHLTTDSPGQVLPLAVALGLADAWAKYVKAHPAGTPPWFSAVERASDDGAFVALIAASGASSGAGGAGASGAGGGGASGAS